MTKRIKDFILRSRFNNVEGMLVTYVKLIFRKLVRNRVYPVINIVGLVIAFTVSLLICSHIVKEGKTDSFHVGGDRIYRVTRSRVIVSGPLNSVVRWVNMPKQRFPVSGSM